MTRMIHLASNLSYTHMNGRWHLPGSWDGRTRATISRCYRAVHARRAARGQATGSRGGSDLTAVVELLVPELQRRGRFRTAYRGRTLREHLAEVE